MLLELLNRDHPLRDLETRSEREVHGVRLLEEREFDILTSRIRSVITRLEGTHVETRRTDWRVHSLHELSNMGRKAGITLVAAYADLDRSPARLDTRLVRLVFACGDDMPAQESGG